MLIPPDEIFGALRRGAFATGLHFWVCSMSGVGLQQKRERSVFPQIAGSYRGSYFSLVARCAIGFCKRGCTDACVELVLARYSMGEVVQTYIATCCLVCYGSF